MFLNLQLVLVNVLRQNILLLLDVSAVSWGENYRQGIATVDKPIRFVDRRQAISFNSALLMELMGLAQDAGRVQSISTVQLPC